MRFCNFFIGRQNKRVPVVLSEDGTITFYDLSGEPDHDLTSRMMHVWSEEIRKHFSDLNRCETTPAKTLEELIEWTNKVTNAEQRLLEAKKQIEILAKEPLAIERSIIKDLAWLQHRLKEKYTYQETLQMGCTDIVYWNNESLTNPKTGNEFFTPEDAKSILQSMKSSYLEKNYYYLQEKKKDEEKGEEFHFPGEIDMEYCYIWENADLLYDLVDEEMAQN